MSRQVVYHQASERHSCEARREGDWVIYTCPQCDYRLRDNLITGEMQIENASRDVAHSGEYRPLH